MEVGGGASSPDNCLSFHLDGPPGGAMSTCAAYGDGGGALQFAFSTISNQRFLYIYDLWEHYIYHHTCSVPINRNFASGSRMILIKVITFIEFRFLKIMQVLKVFHQPKRYSKHSNKSISQFSFNKTSALGHRPPANRSTKA